MTRLAGQGLAVLIVLACFNGHAAGDVVRVWPTAVVDNERVTLGDVCDLSKLRSHNAEDLATTLVVASPPPGGSTYVTVDAVQDALRRAGVNLATALVSGATKCAVSRPKEVPPPGARRATRTSKAKPTNPDGRTLREAVHATFQRHAIPAGGRIELQFGRTSSQILNLTEPQYTFDVRLKGGRWLGRVVNVDVDVFAGDDKVQTVHLVVNASIAKQIVVARQSINQKASLHRDDVQLAERNYENLDRVPATRIEAVVGQRARRFIPAGRAIHMNDLELVPLVTRGQLVDVVSMVGGVEARAVAKAAGSGCLGDVIELRTGGRRGHTLMGMVVGERKVMVGNSTAAGSLLGPRLALGGGR